MDSEKYQSLLHCWPYGFGLCLISVFSFWARHFTLWYPSLSGNRTLNKIFNVFNFSNGGRLQGLSGCHWWGNRNWINKRFKEGGNKTSSQRKYDFSPFGVNGNKFVYFCLFLSLYKVYVGMYVIVILRYVFFFNDHWKTSLLFWPLFIHEAVYA